MPATPFHGEWRTLGRGDTVVYNFISTSLVTVQRVAAGAEPVPHQWSLQDGEHVLQLTCGPATTLFRIRNVCDEQIQLQPVGGESGTEEDEVEAIVLVPASVGSANESLVEDDSGVDMGMDLCITGTAMKIHREAPPQ